MHVALWVFQEKHGDMGERNTETPKQRLQRQLVSVSERLEYQLGSVSIFITLGFCSCATVVLHSSLAELGRHAVHLTVVTKTKVIEILVAD
jgi:hypothetical protein